MPDNPPMPSPASSHRPAPVTPRAAGAMVKAVARSFALSVQILPERVRWPVTLAYLLARASDAVADSVELAPEAAPNAPSRAPALEVLRQAIAAAAQHREPGPDLALLDPIQQQIPLASERRLLHALPLWLNALHDLPAEDRQLIGQVCETILSGQRLDVQRFGVHTAHAVVALRTRQEVEDYTWRVAGCVGEFWGLICETHLPGWRQADLSVMISAGIRYGQGLQRLNMLRDTAPDLAQGRCYWSEEELQSVGLSAGQLAHMVQQADRRPLAVMAPLWSDWVAQTRAGLSLGVAYSVAITPWRLRLASALPALIGLRTLQVLEKRGPAALAQPVKVPRSWVYKLLLQLLLSGGTPRALRRIAQGLGATPQHLSLPAPDGTMRP